MRKLIGQAAWSTARLLHRVVEAAVAVLVFAAVGIGALGWRLSTGPLELPWLIPRLEDAANAAGGPARITIGTASLAWEGFSGGAERPLDIRLADVAAIDGNGARIAEVSRAAVTLSVFPLLVGRIVPRSIEVEAPQVHVVRSREGAMEIELGGVAANPETAAPSQAMALLAEFFQELARPPTTDRGSGSNRWSELRRVRIRDAVISVVDRQLGVTWQSPRATLDLLRQSRGGVSGSADVALALGQRQARLTAQATPDADAGRTAIQVQLTPLRPSDFATIAPQLAALDAAVTLTGGAELNADLTLENMLLRASVGPGRIRLGNGEVPLLDATLEAQGTPQSFDLRLLRLAIAPGGSGPATVVRGSGAARRDAGVVRAAVGLDLDQVAFADLPALWPDGVGGKGARAWVTENITGGVARGGHLDLTLQAPEDFSDATVNSIAGSIDGHDLTAHWLRPMPPIEHGEATLTVHGLDAIEVAVQAGRQGGLAIRSGTVRFSGLAAADQFADIDAEVAGPLADTIALLRHPRLRLFEHRPLALRDPGGQVAAELVFSHLPLRQQVALDDIQIRSTAHLTEVHLGDVVAGRDLDHGTLDADVGNDGMKLSGNAELAGISTQLQAELDFRAGPPTQVLEKIALSGSADDRQLAGAGLDTAGMLIGPAGIQAVLQSRRDGHGEGTVHADLGHAELRLARLNWSKPAGRPAVADTHLLLDHEQVAGIDKVQIAGDGIEVQGQLDFAAGRPVLGRLQRLRLGPGTDAHGEVRWPPRAGAAWNISMSGPSIDATAQLSRKSRSADDRPGPPWTLDAQFDRVVLGAGRDVSAVQLHIENDGRLTRQARLNGKTPGDGAFSIAIAPAPGGRRLSGDSSDAGGLLRALDVIDGVQGGRLTLAGSYDDGTAAHVLSGMAEIADFRLLNAPALGKLLQAMTLYGLVDVLQGPGMGFSQLVAPFRLNNDVLELNDARAYSASLGMTAKGRIDLAGGDCAVQGTIVPAYFFNSLLGGIPFVGRLFSPERGGGLFAATYSLTGNCEDPNVSVNPLAALTPGFLRGLFGIFQGDAAAPPVASQPRSRQ